MSVRHRTIVMLMQPAQMKLVITFVNAKTDLLEMAPPVKMKMNVCLRTCVQPSLAVRTTLEVMSVSVTEAFANRRRDILWSQPLGVFCLIESNCLLVL